MSLQGKRIFIVEDNVQNKTIMQLLLEMQGATIAIDRWGRDTLRRLQAFAPVDLILMDLMLPNNVTGYELFNLIRVLPEFASVPIIAVSAADPSESTVKTQAYGFAGFIAKPIEFEAFPQQIAQILARETTLGNPSLNRGNHDD
jgi:CheY-like chemotaxis protein